MLREMLPASWIVRSDEAWDVKETTGGNPGRLSILIFMAGISCQSPSEQGLTTGSKPANSFSRQRVTLPIIQAVD